MYPPSYFCQPQFVSCVWMKSSSRIVTASQEACAELLYVLTIPYKKYSDDFEIGTTRRPNKPSALRHQQELAFAIVQTIQLDHEDT